jgi:hypothetical protein
MTDEYGDCAALQALQLARQSEYRFAEHQFWVDVAAEIVRSRMTGEGGVP